MNGVVFLSQARIVAPNAVRVLLTGQASVTSALDAVNQGSVFRFLTKPCSPADLGRAIDDAIEQARLVTADRDLLERKLDAMSGHLVRAERMASLGTLAGAVGHELNNVAAVLSSTIGFIKDDLEEGKPPSVEDLDSLEKVVAHLGKHARNLLELGRPRAPEESVDLATVVRSAVELMGVPLRHVQLSVKLPDEPVTIDADPAEIEQVLVNLLKNGAEATKEAGRFRPQSSKIAVELVVDGAEVVLSVTDNGVGIPRGDRPLIFEPYFTTKPHDRGTGLGLFVVKQIVERLHGEVEVESDPGSGARFAIRLPVAMAVAA
jgi:two-component system C4-dicarboxylate transport sensor histidine kinase DctB